MLPAVTSAPGTTAPAPLPLRPMPVPSPVTVPSALGQGDRVQLSGSNRDIKAQLAPVFRLVEQAGYPQVAARLREARFVLTDGKAFGMEYYAAAYVGGVVAFNRDAFKYLSDREIAAILVHEGTHLMQSPLQKAYSNIVSLGGRNLRHNVSEREAYLVQWDAMRKLGVTKGEIYWGCIYALEDMGRRPADAPPDA